MVEESQEWEGDLVFTVRSQKLREPDRLGQVSLRHALEVEILKSQKYTKTICDI